jgi:hypothetical protein
MCLQPRSSHFLPSFNTAYVLFSPLSHTHTYPLCRSASLCVAFIFTAALQLLPPFLQHQVEKSLQNINSLYSPPVSPLHKTTNVNTEGHTRSAFCFVFLFYLQQANCCYIVFFPLSVITYLNSFFVSITTQLSSLFFFSPSSICHIPFQKNPFFGFRVCVSCLSLTLCVHLSLFLGL